VRTKWLTDRDYCAPQRVTQQQRVVQKTVTPPQQMRTVASFTREERTVYFQFDRSALLPEAKERLDTLSTSLKADKSVKEAKIVGFADRIGSEAYNERLSQKRAETVRDYLIANGYTNARVTETRWVGESQPSTECPAATRTKLIACLQNDRRVEVEIGYVQEGQMPATR
jgi:OOP family OmpA-OmpF porin